MVVTSPARCLSSFLPLLRLPPPNPRHRPISRSLSLFLSHEHSSVKDTLFVSFRSHSVSQDLVKMGLLSFLNTNKQRPQPGYPELKAQSYDTTAIALPPIRGSLPVQGNGPNTLDDLKRAARKRSEAQLSARTAPLVSQHEAASPAPAPIVARLRSKSLGRPSTAPSLPNNTLPGISRPKSAGKNTPSFINPKRAPGPPYLLGVNGPEDKQTPESEHDVLPPVPPIAARFMSSLPSSPVTTTQSKGPASITGSVLSGRSDGHSSKGGKAGHVDLLDASGAFKPSDFRTRLQASGARDYGEDVAERNMGVNGVDLNSPAVLAFYALTGGAPLAYRSDGSAVDVHGNRYAAGNIPTDLANHVHGKDQDELLRMANQKMRTAQFPTRTTSLQAQPALAAAALSNDETPIADVPARRLSLHGAPVSNSSKPAKQRPLSMHPVLSATSANIASATAPEVPRSRPTTSSSSIKSSSRNQSRDRKKKKPSKEEPNRQYDHDDRTRRPRSSSSASRKARNPNRQGDFSQFNFGVAGTDKSLPPLPSSDRPSTSNGADYVPQGGSAQSRSSSQPRSHPRNRSTGAASLRSRAPQLHDIEEHLMPTPARDNGSISSITPSTVASSNNQSRHTADTSLDLGFSMPKLNQSNKMSHVRGKSSGATSGRIMSTTYASQRAQAPSPFVRPADGDDYLTTTTDGSDVESYLDKRRKRQQDGEHLLFNENRYGPTGGGLPGLFDSGFDQDPTTPTFAKPPSARSSNANSSRPPTSAPRMHTKPPSLVSWQDNSSSSSLTVSESEISKTGFSGGYDRDEEEMDGKLDVKLAVRLRKEMKKRERLPTKRRPGNTKALENYEQGHVADTEG